MQNIEGHFNKYKWINTYFFEIQIQIIKINFIIIKYLNCKVLLFTLYKKYKINENIKQ